MMSKIKNTASLEPNLTIGFRTDNEGNIQGAAIFDHNQRAGAIVLIPIGETILPIGV